MARIPTSAEVAEWSDEERASVARSLDAHIDRPVPHKRTRRQRRILIAITVISAMVLLPWIGLLSVTLRETSSGGAWRIAWVGFDTALFVSFAVSGFLLWRRRQMALVAVTVNATLLLTDAWFDISLSWNTPEFTIAVLSAVIVEIPLSIVLVGATTRMLRMNASMFRALRGLPRESIRLRRERVPMVVDRDPGHV